MKLVVKICSRSVCPVKTIKDSGCVKITIMCLYNLKGNVQKSIPTKSDPWDIAVTTGGDLQ